VVGLPQEATINSSLLLIRPYQALLPKYLYYNLAGPKMQDLVQSRITGSATPHLFQKDIKTFELAIPPLAEQRRIVAAVEQLLEKVLAAREKLERVSDAMKRFRKAVIVAACSGRLTETWRVHNPNVQPIVDVLATLARTRRVELADQPEPEDELPAKWSVTTLGFLTEPKLKGRPCITSGSRGWAKYVGRSGRYFIRSENINTEYLRLDESVRVDPPMGAEADRTQVRPGDLLLTITGNNVGRTAVVPADCPQAHVSQHVAIIRVERGLYPDYLWLWLRSEHHGQRRLEHYGETKPGLNLEQVRDVVVHLPPIAEQKEIVRRVTALLQMADSIDQRAAAALQRVQALTQSILAKAFRGELVPTEAELARREKRTYETASELLDRIRAVAGETQKPKRRRSRASE
jgi:type I restriction enzyme S subunit